MKRAHIEGLRKSDPITLSVLVQDLVRKPLVGLDPRSLADLFALAGEETLPTDLRRDLRKFQDQMIREIADLPDGHVLQEWLEDLLVVDASRFPSSFRDAVVARGEDIALKPASTALLLRVEEHFAGTAASAVEITEVAATRVQKGPDVLSPQAKKARAQSGERRSTGRAVSKDPARGQWIRADLIERLQNYGSRGLKQAMLVAGAKHRAPWDDLKDAEILAVLRELERLGKVKRSTNRWALSGRW